MKYIKLPKVYEKLKKAEEFYAPVIMTASNGWGKSAAAENFYRRKNPLTLYCKDGNITEMPDPESFRASTVIIEDMQWLSEPESIRYLRKLLRTRGIQVVMLTRGGVPKYLAGEDMDLGFVRVQESDFTFGPKEVDEYFQERGVELDPHDIAPVTEASGGYVCALHCYVERMRDGERYSEDIRAAVWQDIYRLWDSFVFEQWSDEFVHFALSICQYDSFNVEMAEYLTGDRNTGRVIEYCYEKMNQIKYHSGGYYSLRPEVKGFYIWKQDQLWPKEEVEENFRRAANFYEMKGDIALALKYYKKAGATQRVKELLIMNVNTHPGVGHYVETKDYYFAIPEEELKELPVLTAGMSMLYDLILMPEKSEEWYKYLVEYYKDTNNSKERRREARTRLAYLDIALPHRGTKGILRIMKDVFALVRKGDIVLPEFGATGNIPSIMNGGLDFSEWSKNDTQIAKFMGKPLEVILGKFGNGLVTLSLAESGFEKATMSAYEVLTRCNDGYEAAAHGGKIEMCFVSTGIQVRQHLVEGQLPSAKRVYKTFCEKASKEEARHLEPNIKAMGTWIALYGGFGSNIKDYIEKTPEARVSFSISDRYRQMIKIRCLISENRLEEAFDLACFMDGYIKTYERTFYKMENDILKAVILFRMGDDHWKEHLIAGIGLSCEYHFVRTISLEGAAVLPLLKQVMNDEKVTSAYGEFLDTVYKECQEIALCFPDYLKFIPKEVVQFTKREAQVLAMLCDGRSTDEICEELDITYDGLKKHNRNIYKKLGVKSRAEAERKAVQLGLVHRG